jgi:hypothetical protein
LASNWCRAVFRQEARSHGFGDIMDADLLRRAIAALGIDASQQSREIIDRHLESIAAELFLEWMTGERRFDSQSQQTQYWLSKLYEKVFTDEQPDAGRIYERFGIPLPRATYLARQLRVSRAAHWRKAARAELLAQLTRHKAAAEEAKAGEIAHITEFDVSLSPGAADELRVRYDRIAEFDPREERPRPPRGKPWFGGPRWLAIPAITLLAILETLSQE